MEHRSGSDREVGASAARPAASARAVGLIGHTPVTLLRAPAGFGKSTAMRAHRAASTSHRSAWVSFATVRPLQIDRIAELLIAAVEALATGSASVGQLRSLVPSRGPAFGHRFVDEMWATLQAIEEPWRLYLDDLHRLPSTPSEELGDLLTRFADEGRRATGLLIAASRATPPWPVARWQLAGWLTLIGPHELRLDAGETRTVLGEQHAAHAEQILATTSGWPAAVATVASLFDGHSIDGPLPAAVSVAESLDAYIRDEVLAELDPTDVTVLTCLLVVGDAPPPVVASVCGDVDAGARLRRLAGETALVVEHTDERFSLHPLLARLLAERLERLGLHEIRSLHERAAQAWAEFPESIDGIAATSRHLAAAGDAPAALEHLRQHWERFFDGGRLDMVVDGIEAIPSRYWRHDIGLSLVLGWSNMLLGRETRAQEVFHGTALVDDPAGAAIWKIIRSQGTWWSIDPDEAMTLLRAGRRELAGMSDEAMPHIPGHQTVRAFLIVADIAELRALLLSGRLTDADDLGARVHEILWDLEPLGMASVLAMRSLVAALRGRPHDARLWAEDALRRADDLDGDRVFAAPAHLALAVVDVVAGDAAAAPAHLDQAITVARRARAGNLLGMCDLVAAMICGTTASVRSAPVRHPPLPFVDAIVAARAAVARLHHGDLDGAERTLLGVAPDELTMVEWAEVLLAVRPRREAARLIAERPPPTSPAGSVLRLLAEAACLPGSADASIPFRQAVELAHGNGIIGLALQAPDSLVERPEIASLDERLVRRVLDERSHRRAADDRPRFTSRELEVLERTARSETAGEIARRMYLSVNTVKWHKANIYRKLGVDGATAAISRARELGLLAD